MTNAIKTTHVDGDVSIGRNVNIGGRTTQQGDMHVKGSIKIDGWIDAKNIKSACKGLFRSESDLTNAYPEPRNGWWAIIGDTIPGIIYIAKDGIWNSTQKTGGSINIDIDHYNNLFERLSDDVHELDTKLDTIDNELEKMASNIEIKAGSFKSAQQKAKDNNGLWMWMLEEGEIKKPIWHVGSGVFIDAVGAEVFIEPELNVFKYTAILTQDNDTIVVPTSAGIIYDMVVDWGDGSDVQSVSGLISRKTLTHKYTGAAGTKYQITLKGVVPALPFGGNTTYSEPAQLYSIDENTLQNDIKMTTDSSFDADFRECINLVHISEDAVHNLKPKTKICFKGCSSLKSLPPRLLDGFELISLSNFVAGCSVLELSEDFMNNLAQKISGVTSLFYAFQGCKGKIHIPDNFFDNIAGNITDVRQMTLNATGVTGDAKKLYDSLSTKVISEGGLGCFSGANLSNRDQVPTTWGGTMK